MKIDTWFAVGGFLTTCLFVYLIFHKEKCPNCAAREEIDKVRVNYKSLGIEELDRR